jgi:hypothetical protein
MVHKHCAIDRHLQIRPGFAHVGERQTGEVQLGANSPLRNGRAVTFQGDLAAEYPPALRAEQTVQRD